MCAQIFNKDPTRRKWEHLKSWALFRQRKRGRNANLKMSFHVINFSHSCVSLSISLQARPFPFQRHRQELFSHHELTTKLSNRNWKDSKGKWKCEAHSWALLISGILSLHITLQPAALFPKVLKKNNLLT